MAYALCLFCGGPDEPGHACDGRQGVLEADDTLYGQQGDVPYEAGSETSAQAAHALGDDERQRLEAVVYAVLAAQPRTCDDIEGVTGLPHQTASARIRGLVLKGQVMDSGDRATTRHRRRAVVWRVRTAADNEEGEDMGCDPDTSVAPVTAADKKQLQEGAALAEALHRRFGPMADFEYLKRWQAVWTGTWTSPHLYRQARATARDKGVIRDSGHRLRNPETGREQVVWEACTGEAPVVEKCELCGHVLRKKRSA